MHWAFNTEASPDRAPARHLSEPPAGEFDYLDETYADREFYPLDAPHMPIPGHDFLMMADDLGDFTDHDWFLTPQEKKDRKADLDGRGLKVPKRRFNVVKGVRDEKRLHEPGPRLDRLYRQATYAPAWCMKLYDKEGGFRTVATVPGHVWGDPDCGPRPARVMVIGKWPGYTEIKEKRNLAGPSGDELREALRLAGVPEREYLTWYVTNLIKHPDLPGEKKDKVPARWANNWRVVLEQELRIVRPDFILLLGTDAVQYTLCDMELGGVTSIQGRSIPWRFCLERDRSRPPGEWRYHDCMVMACRHPAAVAREPVYRDEFWGTVNRFKGMLDGGRFDPASMVVDHRVVSDEDSLRRIVDGCLERGESCVALDCEWHGQYPGEPGAWLRTVQFSTRSGSAVCVKIRQGGYHPDPPYSADEGVRRKQRPEQFEHPDFGKVVFEGGEAGVVRQLTRLLVDTPDRKVRIIGHNLRADLPWLALGLDRTLGAALIDQFAAAETPELTRTEGGFDTTLALHAVYESPGDSGYKLEAQALNHCGVPRYDDEVVKWRQGHCKANKLKKDDLEGYGHCPDDLLLGKPLPSEQQHGPGVRVKDSYACFDADATFRLFEAFNGKDGLPGKLDKDPFEQDCRKPFWISMRASPACLEMEMNGIRIDKQRAASHIDTYKRVLAKLQSELQDLIGWPGFNPGSHPQCCALLFGPELAGKKYKNQTISLRLTPVVTSQKPQKPWEKALREKTADGPPLTPSTDKMVLGILRSRLYARTKKDPADEQAKLAFQVLDTLRNIRFVAQILKAVLVSHQVDWDPKSGTGSGHALRDVRGDLVYKKGLLKWIYKSDGKVHTHVQQTKETGRYSTVRPPLQNLSKRRESSLKTAVEALVKRCEARGEMDCPRYSSPVRSVLVPTPGWVFVEADFIGAELAMMAIQAGDKKMIDHCRRANLKESDPDFYDIHSNVGVKAFQLKVNDFVDAKSGKPAYEVLGLPLGSPCPALKSALQAIGKGTLRDVAKTIAFGIPYGRGDDAVVRAVEEEGVLITLEEAAAIRASILSTYPRLEPYLAGAQHRVTNPGYIVNCHGRRRRFYVGGRDDGKAEREAGNFGIQGGVADHLSLGLYNLYTHRARWHKGGPGLAYRMVLQIHDAVLFEVRPQYVTWFVDEVLKECLTDGVALYQCDFEGRPVPGAEPHYLGVEATVYKAWGEKYSAAEGEAIGLLARFCAGK